MAIDNRLHVVREADGVPGLQGAGTPPRSRWARLWRSPMVQFGARTAGVALVGYGIARARRIGHAA